mgnify:CR=1 FL=1
MDREQDVLLLFMTMHGTAEHQLFVQMPPFYVDLIDPRQLRTALDDALARAARVLLRTLRRQRTQSQPGRRAFPEAP